MMKLIFMLSSLDETGLKRIHLKITALSAGGVFLDGFDISVISVALILLKPEFGLNYLTLGLIAASTLMGMMVGGIGIGYITDIKGRKYMYLWDMVLFLVFTALIAISTNFTELFTFRFMLGVAIGADYAISSTIISEFSPKKYRGKLLALNPISWGMGAVVAYIVSFLLLPLGPQSWRLMFAVGIIPAVIILIGRRTIPESPRWLIKDGKPSKAVDIIKGISGVQEQTDVLKTEKTSIRTLFKREYIASTIFMSVFWFSFDVAAYGIGIFTPTILLSLGFKTVDLAILGTLMFKIISIIGGILCVVFIDKLGRKKITAMGFLGMFISLIVLAITFPPTMPIVIGMFVFFELTDGFGPGGTNFVYPQELFPTSIRATAHGFGTTVSRVGAILGITTFPYIKHVLGLRTSLLFFGAFALIGLLVTVALGKETKGKTLEELTEFKTQAESKELSIDHA
ncbi:inner membrane metabolite transport protein YgcS [archaeon]|nr:inner membrane metabolite transport protein YgcS [archaeon]